MIQAKELRVGNFVDHPAKQNTFCEIHTICRYDKPVKITDNPLGYLYETILDELEPIPITPEILEQCGYELIKLRGWYWRIKYYEVENHIYWMKIFKDENGNWVTRNIYAANYILKYLHQLQNLFYALTGQELKIVSLCNPLN